MFPPMSRDERHRWRVATRQPQSVRQLLGSYPRGRLRFPYVGATCSHPGWAYTRGVVRPGYTYARGLAGGWLAAYPPAPTFILHLALPESEGLNMTDLEKEVVELRGRLDTLAKRVRLTQVAQEFLAETQVFRVGDAYRDGDEVFRIWDIKSPEACGKPYEREGERPENPQRLYTAEEVAEIIAAVTPGPGLSRYQEGRLSEALFDLGLPAKAIDQVLERVR